MLRSVYALAALLLAAAFLYTGNGLQFTLISVRADFEAFSATAIGAIVAGYYAGFIAGCRITPRFIHTVGHIRTFVALASVASASALAHAIFIDALAWAGLRAITGVCFAGMAMVLESWLNERASNENRGRILSVYRIVDLLALMTGNALLSAASPAGFELFAVTSILVSIALVPIALTRTNAPTQIEIARLDLPALVRISPVGAAAAGMIGLANASFWSIAPLFVTRLGYPPTAVSTFMICVIAGAAAAQWPLGWISDKIDRRIVLSFSALTAACVAIAVSQYASHSTYYLFVLGAVLGAFMIPMFGLAIAHANDQAGPKNAVATNGGLLLLHGCGAIIGAFGGAQLLSLFGPSALFYYIASIYTALAIFTLIRIFAREAPSDKTTFTPVPRGATPTVFEIAREDDEGDGTEQ